MAGGAAVRGAVGGAVAVTRGGSPRRGRGAGGGPVSARFRSATPEGMLRVARRTGSIPRKERNQCRTRPC